MYNNPSSSFGMMIKLVNESVTRSLAFCSRDYAMYQSGTPIQLLIPVRHTENTVPTQDACIGFMWFHSANFTNYGNADFYAAFSQQGLDYGENADRT